MIINYSISFSNSLDQTVKFIERDSSLAKEKFKEGLSNEISRIRSFPRMFRKSIYFDDLSVRDLIYKGYVVIYKILNKNECLVFQIIKHRKVFYKESKHY